MAFRLALQRATTDFLLPNFVSDENGTFCITALLTPIGMLNGRNHKFRHCGLHCGALVALFVQTSHKLIVYALRICV
jgi:hypothetical protein